MDYDMEPPFPIDDYRKMQRSIPGVEALYSLISVLVASSACPNAEVLIVGAGGGREIEVLARRPQRYRFMAVDPSKQMLQRARDVAEHCDALDRTTFIEGESFDAPPGPYSAATSILVMHFLPDDGEKLRYLRSIRERLNRGAVYVHADVSFDDRDAFERLTPPFIAHAVLSGLSEEQAGLGPQILADMPIISERRTVELLGEAGFSEVAPFFRGLWYAGWWARAA